MLLSNKFNARDTPVITHYLFIKLIGTWSLKTYGKNVKNLDILAILNPEKLHELLDFLSKARIRICTGKYDYYEMIDKRAAFENYLEFKDKKGSIRAVLENNHFASSRSLQTIRLLNCKMLTLNENKCNVTAANHTDVH